MTRRISAGVVAGLLFVVSVVPAFGQTPVAEPPNVPTECMVSPLGFLDVLAMLNDIDDAQDTRLLSPIQPVSLAEIVPGDPISDEDMSAIAFTTHNLVGCANSFEVMSVLALLSKDFQMRLVLEAMSQPNMDDLVEQVPLLGQDAAEAGGLQAIPIKAAWYAEDNTREIMAVLEPVVSDPSSRNSFLVTYVFSIDQWLIDDIQLIEGTDGA